MVCHKKVVDKCDNRFWAHFGDTDFRVCTSVYRFADDGRRDVERNEMKCKIGTHKTFIRWGLFENDENNWCFVIFF